MEHGAGTEAAQAGDRPDLFHPSMLQMLLAAIVESSDDAIISKTLDGTIRSWNRGAERMLGYRAEEAIGRSIELIVPPELVGEEHGILARLQRGERVDHFETVRIAKDGRRVPMAITVSPIFGDDGRIVGASKVGRDIGPRKEAERLAAEARSRLRSLGVELAERVEERTESLSQFTYQVSHDLGSPLRAIQGFADALLENHAAALDETGRLYVERIAAGAARMDQLLADLLAYSRLDGSQIDLEAVSLRPLVDEALETLGEALRERGAVIERADEPVRVLGDATLLSLVLANLLDNASKFVAEGRPRVRVVTGDRGKAWLLSISDNGVGVPPEHSRRIWSPFERLHGEGQFPGSGIGLALVARSVAKMGGRCGVDPAPGGGSRFWIELRKANGEGAAG